MTETEESYPTENQPTDFDKWFEWLTQLAKERGLSWLIADKDSHRDSFKDGNTPKDELNELIAEATRNA